MINKKILQNDFIAKLTIQSDKLFIPQAQEFVLYYAKLFKFAKDELQKIELITEEAILNTIENSFGKDDFGPIDIKVIYKPGEFIISVEDKGIPLDFKKLEAQTNSSIGILLMKNLAEEFRFINMGKEGKKMELIKRLPEENISDLLAQEEKDKIEEDKDSSVTEKPSIRLIEHDDAEMLARLAFKVYGYTYNSIFYFPEQIREMIERNLLVSAVCVNNDNEIVGNLSLIFEYSGAKVADSAAAMVDPRYRGHNLFKEMKTFLQNYAVQNNMYGLYSEAVTIHTFTQQGNISLGAKETGILLAFLKEKQTFKKINNDKLLEQRQAVVLYYLKTNQEPNRTVYLCEKFFPVLKKVYDKLNLDRNIVMIPNDSECTYSSPNSSINTSVKPWMNVAVIKINSIGADAYDLIYNQLKEFRLKKIETIYLEMPVSEPCSALLTEKLNKVGFMLSGIIPEFDNGDYIKLQYLNNVRVDTSHIKLASDLAKEILNEIMKDYN